MLSDRARLDFAAALGDAHVCVGEVELDAAATATFTTEQRVAAIVRPKDVAEVQTCVHLAREHELSLYPISRGHNWGYGSRVPVRSGALLLELSRLDRIENFDDELGVVDVEPGVSFRSLSEFLRARRAPWLNAAIGGSPDSSLVGNLVERGIGKGPYGDRCAHVCNLEIVSASGEVLRTGLGRFAGARAAQLHRWGLGPSLDGLFMQSPFGIVTRMTQWLMPRPGHFQLSFYRVRSGDALPGLLDALRRLMLAGALRPTLTLYNDYRVLSVTGDYPFERSAGHTPLSDELRLQLRAAAFAGRGMGDWAGDIAVHAPDRAHARATRALLERELGDFVEWLDVIDADADEIDALLAGRDDASAARDDRLEAGLLRNFLGVADDDAIRSVYWRKRAQPAGTLEPERDRCGLIWCSAIAPFRGRDIVPAVELLRATLLEHGFEPGLTLQCLSERSVYMIASITYDREVPGEDARALACHRRVAALLLRAGYPPYRLALDSLPSELLRGDPATAVVLEQLGATLDPEGLFGRGRYVR